MRRLISAFEKLENAKRKYSAEHTCVKMTTLTENVRAEQWKKRRP